jgi:uncharacterized protein
MKIGVLSDTHIAGRSLHPKKLASRYINKVTTPAAELIEIIRPHFKDVEMIIHAGDFVSYQMLAALEEFGPVKGVAGNMDPREVSSRMPSKAILKIENFRIGVMHGFGPATGLEKKIRREFEDVDMIIFGHTHHQFDDEVDGIRMFNPGSPTDQRWAPCRSIGLLEIGDEIKTRIIPLD